MHNSNMQKFKNLMSPKNQNLLKIYRSRIKQCLFRYIEYWYLTTCVLFIYIVLK
jgi:hypothetical protein